jgi:Ni/Co efflux regulator RcnB
MNKLMIGVTMLTLLASPAAIAQPDRRPHEDRGSQPYENARSTDHGRHLGWGRERGNHYRWSRGQRMGHNDWNRAQRIDYRRFNLRQPPRGYEWRRTSDRYVLVQRTSGLIMSVILVRRR